MTKPCQPASRPFYREVSDYAGLRDALRARVEQLNVSRNCLDSAAGLAPGYVGKLLGPYSSRKIGGISLGLLVQAAGLKMALVDDSAAKKVASVEDLEMLLRAARLKMLLLADPAAAARIEPLYEQRAVCNVRLNNDSRKSKGRRTPKKKYKPV